MRSYKEFEKVGIGSSDIASVVIRTCSLKILKNQEEREDGVAELHFGKDSDYSAYECIGDDVEIGAHYKPVFEGATWLKIYDDSDLTYEKYMGYPYKVTIYRAGEMGCIIHWHK